MELGQNCFTFIPKLISKGGVRAVWFVFELIIIFHFFMFLARKQRNQEGSGDGFYLDNLREVYFFTRSWSKWFHASVEN